MKYQIENTLFGFRLQDESMGYALEVLNSTAEEPIFQVALTINHPFSGRKVLVTGRDYDSYPKLDIDPDKQYLEIGTGFGGFIPGIVERFHGRLKHKLIAIEQMNYDSASTLLQVGGEVSRHRGYPSDIVDRIDLFKARADTYTYSEDINLITLPLGWAIKTFPELQGRADVVVDNCASTDYNQVEFPFSRLYSLGIDKICLMRSSLLKPDGIIIE